MAGAPAATEWVKMSRKTKSDASNTAEADEKSNRTSNAKKNPEKTQNKASSKKSSAKGSSNKNAKSRKDEEKAARKAAKDKQREAKDKQKKNGRKEKKPNIFKRFANYLHAVRIELKRVSWPTGIEVRNQTLVVIFALVFFGVLIWLVDTGISPLLLAYSQLLG
jgi:preprotein translocase subunit SecE